MLGLESEIGCLGKRCPVLIPTACGARPMAGTAAAARKEDPSLPPLNLSTMPSAVKDVIYRRGNLKLHSGSQTAELSTHEIS